MAQLQIYVTAQGGKTVSQYGVSEGQKIWFQNDGAAELTIGFKVGQPETLKFCKNKNDESKDGEAELKIAAGKKEGVFICSDFDGTSFGYNAQIAGTVLEDPIIIIQKDDWSGFIAANPLAIGIGVAAGIVVTLVAQRLFARKRPT